jgi:hypothetical protein
MAGPKRGATKRVWPNPLLTAALLLLCAVCFAQQPKQVAASTGSLAGRLTDLFNKPIEAASVLVRNESTGEESRATTGKNGVYLFTGLRTGYYTIQAESPRLGRGQLGGILVESGRIERVVTAMVFVPKPNNLEVAAGEGNNPPLVAPTPPPIHPATANLDHPKPDTQSSTSVSTSQISTSLVDSQETARLAADQLVQRIRRQAAELKPPTEAITLSTTLEGNSILAMKLLARALPRPVAEQSAAKSEPAAKTAPAAQNKPVPGVFEPNGGSTAGQALSAVAAGVLTSVLPSSAMRTKPAEAHPSTEATKPESAASGSANPAPPTATALTTQLTSQELQALPASGRHWQDFVLDTPTVGAAEGGEDQAAVRGSGSAQTGLTVDGANQRLAFGGSGASSQAGSGQATAGQSGSGQPGAQSGGSSGAWSGGRGLAIAEVAIRSVETIAGNVESKDSRAAGGELGVHTQQGGNELHGQGFLFDRQNTWGARNPFTQWVQETAANTPPLIPTFTGLPYTPPDRELVWGLGAGSRIRRDKLFWFAAVDSYNRNDPGVATVKHPYLTETVSGCTLGPCTQQVGFFAQPTNDQMQVLSARLALPSANPVNEGVGAYSTLLQSLAGLLGPTVRTASQWVGFGRLDWEATERHHFTLEGIGADWNAPGGGLTRTSAAFGSHSFGSGSANEQWTLGRWEAFLTPNLLAVTQASAGREILRSPPSTPSIFEQTFLAGNTFGQLPQIVVDNRYGFTIGNPSRFGPGSYPDEHLYEGQEDLSWVRGNLLVKGGFEVSHNNDSTGLVRNQTGTYSYSSVENFASDAMAFAKYGLSGQLQPADQHNCDQTGKVWRDAAGVLHGLGYLPCYSSYSQTQGPSEWWVSTNDWSSYAMAQWQPWKLVVMEAGLRWDREQMPPALPKVNNPDLPLTQRIPSTGNEWGPRLSLAVGNAHTHWPVLRLGYGIYFGRTENATLETALTHTGSLNGDLNYFLRPTDNLNGGGAPPFPYVLNGPPGAVVKPDAVEFAPVFHNPEIHQAVVAVEETLPGHIELTASALASLGRRLPISEDVNFDPAVNPGKITYAVEDATNLGPIKTTSVTVPFYASWPSATGFKGRLDPNYQQITQLTSRANSTYEAIVLKVSRTGRRGLSLHAHYTYAHAMDWNPNESAQIIGSNLLDPANFKAEYGTSNLDTRHQMALMAIWEPTWKFQNRPTQKLAAGWMLSTILQAKSGEPYTMRTSGSLAEEFEVNTGAPIVALGPGMNGSGGDNRVYGVGRNTFRYPATWKMDLRVGRKFNLGQLRQLEVLAESFNLMNHQNVTQLEPVGYWIGTGSTDGTPPTLNFMNGVKANSTAFGQPLDVNATNFYQARQFQLGIRMRF